MKGGIACGIVALRVLQATSASACAATSCSSRSWTRRRAARARARAIERGHVADAAIVLEPTARTSQPVEGGLEWVRVVVRGRTGHWPSATAPSTPAVGASPVCAIEKAVDAARCACASWSGTGRVHQVHPLMPRGITTINPGVIAGGSGGGADGMPNGMVAYSNIADYCALGLSMKYLPDERRDDVRASSRT